MKSTLTDDVVVAGTGGTVRSLARGPQLNS